MPNWVWVSRVTASDSAAMIVSPVICAVTTKSHAAPEATASARPIHQIHRVRRTTRCLPVASVAE
jgi:hypothetical protein